MITMKNDDQTIIHKKLTNLLIHLQLDGKIRKINVEYCQEYSTM